MIHLKRAYDNIEEDDGYRILVDRLWPRGISKADLQLDGWYKEIAPSDELRQWFDHDPDKFAKFRKRYEAELDRSEKIDELISICQNHDRVTLIYAAKDCKHNNAVVLKDYLENLLN